MALKRNSIKLPMMTPGTEREIAVFRYGKKGARPKVYIQAAIHANEMPGTMALHYLLPMLTEADGKGLIQGEIIVVPTVNPIGQAQLVGNGHAGRYHLLSYDNFNRNWLELSTAVADKVGSKLGQDGEKNVEMIRKAALDALNKMKPVNELQTLRVEIQKLSTDADFVLDLHCDIQAAMHIFSGARDWAHEPIKALTADLGAVASVYNEPYPRVQTFSGVNGALWARLAEKFPEANIPQACMSVTVEMRSQHDVSHDMGQSDAGNLYNWLTRQGVVAGKAPTLPRAKTQGTPMSGVDVGYSQGTGFLVYHLKAGSKVKKGDAICDVINPSDPRGPKARTTYHCQTDGVLFSRRLDGYLSWPGQVLWRIAGAEPLAHRIGATGLDD
jgi:predicted deacylase